MEDYIIRNYHFDNLWIKMIIELLFYLNRIMLIYNYLRKYFLASHYKNTYI